MPPIRLCLLVPVLSCALLALSGCATPGAGASAGGVGAAGSPPGANDIPADAVATTRTEANGDEITEYRVDGRLRALKVVPSRGPVYYIYDRDGDGTIDKAGDNPPQTYFKLFGWD